VGKKNKHKNRKATWFEYNNQLQTVGYHFTGSRPLNKSELMKLDRRGVCLSCHKTIPDKDLATSLLNHVAKFADVKIDNETHSGILNKSIKISAWTQLLLPAAFFIGLFILFWIRRKKRLSH